jgi:hypothetical protein
MPSTLRGGGWPRAPAGVYAGARPCIGKQWLAAPQSRNGSPAWRPAGLATQHPLRGADCLVGRASLRAGPTPCNSPGGDGDRAEGRMPFAALSAGARGGLRERSDLPLADPSRIPPHLHQARVALPYHFSATQAPFPCLRSTCHCPSPARQRSTRHQRRELLQSHPERRCLASLRLRAWASRCSFPLCAKTPPLCR